MTGAAVLAAGRKIGPKDGAETMANFTYRALDQEGKIRKGMIDAPSRAQAIARIHDKKLMPIEVTASTNGASARASRTDTQAATTTGKPVPFWQRGISFRRSVPRAAVAGMARQLATLLRAGLPLDQALYGLCGEGGKSPMTAIIGELREQILSGHELADGLAAFPGVFSSTFVAMVRAGESSGTLELIMERLASHLERQVELQRKVRAALAYPVLMLIVGTAVIVFLLYFVIPQVTKIFADMGKELPVPTQILLGLSDFLRSSWWAILLFALLVGVGFWRAGRTERGKRFLQRGLLRFPLFSGIYAPLLLGNMSRTLGMLLKNGVSLLKSLVIVKSISDNVILRNSIERMIDGVQAGHELSGFMDNELIYPHIARQMVTAGEKSGRLEDMLLWIADDCDSRVAARLHMLTALLEPIMILVLGSIVGFVVIAIILPIFEMSTLAG